jgi:tape measure domain-containing protein
MNKEVEQKILEMQFNNADFEQKVAQSLVTLQKLKEATKLEDAGKGLEDLSRSASNVDLSPISKGIDQLNSHFDALGIFGMTVFHKLSEAAINMGQQVANAITAAPTDGWKEYELNIDSVKTILNSAKNDEGLPVTLDEVNEKLNELNAYSDKTIYSFSDMTSNIGKFTNAGVSLDKSVAAIQGVANVAALAGANSNQASAAMYNFAQALSSGSVRLQDWKSIENANMATVDFKKVLIDAAVEMGTLVEEEGKYVSTTTNMQGKVSDAFDVTQGFNDSLAHQWMTADVLVKALSAYTDETTDLGKAAFKAATEVTTFSKLVDTLKEAMGSGWMQTWQTIVGDYHESIAMWTAVNDVLSGMITTSANARNGMLEAWKAAGGREDLMEGLSNMWKAIMSVARPIKDAWHMIFPSISSTGLVELTRGFKEFTAKLILPRENMNNLRIVAKGLFTLLKAGGQTVSALARTIFPPLFKVIGFGVGIVTSLASGFLKWVATLSSAVMEGNRIYDIIQKLLIPVKLLWRGIIATKDALQTAFGVTKDSLKRASEGFRAFLDVLQQIGDAVGPIIIMGVTMLADAMVNAANSAKAMFDSFKAGKFGQALISRLKLIKDAFLDLPRVFMALRNSLVAGKNPFEDMMFLKTLENSNLGDFIAGFKQDIQKLKNFFKIFIESLKNGTLIDNLSKQLGVGFHRLVEKLKEFQVIGPLIEKIEGFFKKFSGVSGTAGIAVSSFLHNVVDKLKGIDFKSIGIIGLLGSISLFVFRWSKVGKNASGALKALTVFLKNGGQAAQQAMDKYNGFLKIAVAIGIIAGSIWLLAQVPAERFREVCVALAAAFAAMFAAILILSLIKIPEDKIKSIGVAFAGLGVGFLAVAAAAKIIGNMDENELKKGGGALVAFVILVTVAAKLAGKVGVGAGAAFAGLGLALLLLIPSVIIFSKLDTHTLVKGGAAVFAFMLMIAKAAKVAGDAKGTLGAFLGISLGLLLLIPSIKILSKMDAKTLLKGGDAVVALMLMMAEAAKRANGGSKGFLGMAVAIAVITGAMYVLAGLPWAALFMSSKSLAMVLNAIGDALSTVGKMKMSEILKAVLGLTLALAAIGGALYLLTTYGDSTAQLKSALGIAAILVAFRIMAPAIEILSKIPFQAGVVAAGNAMVFFGAMVLCLGALGEVASWGDGAVGEAIVNGAGLVGRVIHDFIANLFGGGKEDNSDQITRLGNSLDKFGGSMSGFLNGLYGVDDQTVTNAKNLATAILALCGADLLNALTGWLRGSKDLGSFSSTLEPLTQAVVDMNAALADETIDGEKIGQVSEVIKTFTDLAQNLPSTGGLLQKALGFKDLGTFAADMKEFMDEGFTDFISSLNSMDLPLTIIPKMMVIQQTTSAMIDLANSLPKSGFISTFIDGTADLGEFATSMAEFLGYDKYGLFVTRVSLVSEADLGKLRGNIIPATQEMINLANKIKSNTSIIDAITGRTNLGKFGETLADFGSGISKFSDSVANVSTIKIVGITGVLFSLADLNASDKVKGNGMSSFGLSINSLGKSLASFIKDTQDVTSERLADISGGMANLHNMLLILAESDYSGVGNFTEAMRTLAETSVTEFVEGFTANTEAATVAIQGFTAAVTEALTGDPEAIKAKARSIITTFSSEIYAPSGKLMMKASGEQMITSLVAGVTAMLSEITKIATLVVATFGAGIASRRLTLSGYGKIIPSAAYNGAKDKTEDFYDLGQDAADGYARGIRSKAQDVADEAREMVSNAIKAAQNEQDSASPSKVFRGLGRDGGEGYALGFGDTVSMVVAAVSDTGHAGILAMQDTIGKIRDNIDTGMNFNPVITPVLDLSQMMSGVTSANAMLSGMELNGLTAAAAVSIANQQNAALAQAQASNPINYAKDLSKLIDNTRKIVDAVRENRYAIIDGDSAFDYFDRRLGMA